jgi:hypothetical protein
MADIRFQILGNTDGTTDLYTLSGSGLAFYGTSAGSSVQIGAYQDNTYVANADGSVYKDATNNVKYVANAWPSGMCTVDEAGGSEFTVGLSGIKTFQSTLGIEFSHSTPVKTQNVQLRIYDRSNINYPASGVNTKVAEIINHNGASYTSQGSAGVSSNVVGSGDAFWWGEAWPSQYVSQNYFTNSSGEVFRNGIAGSNVNGDSRLSAAGIAGSYATVGGTGIVVPLSNSPGSGQKLLQRTQVAGSEGMIWPKWTQYVTNSSNQSAVFGAVNSFGDGSTVGNRTKTYGGTGVDTHHTWAVALSASPLSIGSKEQYGLYISMEYL